jgi:hypothetical protein
MSGYPSEPIGDYAKVAKQLHMLIRLLVQELPQNLLSWQNFGSNSPENPLSQIPSTLISHGLPSLIGRKILVTVEQLSPSSGKQSPKHDGSLGSLGPGRSKSGTPFNGQVHALAPLSIDDISQPVALGVGLHVGRKPGNGGLFITPSGDLLTVDNVRLEETAPKDLLTENEKERDRSLLLEPSSCAPTEPRLVVQLRQVFLQNEPELVPFVQKAVAQMGNSNQKAKNRENNANLSVRQKGC